MLRILKKALSRNEGLPQAARLRAEASFSRGMDAVRGGRFEEALGAFDAAIALDPRSVAAHFNRAAALGDLGRSEESASAYDRCIALSPHWADAHVGLGIALTRLKRFKEARRSLDSALAIEPNAFDALAARADLTRDEGRYAEAVDLYQQLLKAQPDNDRVLNDHGVVLHRLDRFDEALASFDAALRVRPQQAEALVNRGLTLTSLGRYDEALASYKSAKRIAPDMAGAHLNEATCELLLGNFERGWRGYEWRWKSLWWLSTQGAHARRSFDKPLWLGNQTLKRKTIFVHAEQGMGDTLQFVRYAKLLAEKGARVLLEVQAPLKMLLEGVEGVSGLTSVGEPVPEHDLHCPMMSLPLAFGTRLGTIPAAGGYLQIERRHANVLATWRKRLGPVRAPRVGLVWSGNPAHPNDAKRSIPFRQIQTWLSTGLEFHALHSEIRFTDRDAVARDPRLAVWTSKLRNFVDTAALIANLDLVVCVDTGVAHLAGAMGKPVWILLPRDPDWRWLTGRDDSPWYASARLFRQQRAGDWSAPIDEIHQRLESFGRSQ